MIHAIKDLVAKAKMLWWQLALQTFLVGFLTYSLVACSSGSLQTTPTSTSTQTQVSPTSTMLPKGTILFQVDWSRGLSGWQASPEWKLAHGYLQSDETKDLSLTVPYTPITPDYAVEFRLQVKGVNHVGESFSLTVDPASGKDGYHADVLNLKGPQIRTFSIHPEVLVYITSANSDNLGESHDYEAGYEWHTYRAEVTGATVSFSSDDRHLGHAVSSQTKFLSQGPIHLLSLSANLQVGEFRIIAL